MSLSYYVGLLSDGRRIDGFRRGLEGAVRPGDTVLEVGTGLGTYALFAARAGAEHVWAVDRDPVVHAAQMIARTNGLGDRITFIRGEVPGVALPDRVDLIVFEDFPVRLFDDRSWRLIRDVVAAHLRSGGRVFPEKARLNLALAGGDGVGGTLGLRDQVGMSAYDIDWSCLADHLRNAPSSASVPVDSILGEPHRGAPLALDPQPTVEELALDARWTFDRPTVVSALVVWFDLYLGRAGWYENAPCWTDSVWGQTVLPIVPALDVPAGTDVRARVRPEELPDGAPGWLRWTVEADGEERGGHEFAAEPASLSDLYGDIVE